jgi:hypothetical protein
MLNFRSGKRVFGHNMRGLEDTLAFRTSKTKAYTKPQDFWPWIEADGQRLPIGGQSDFMKTLLSKFIPIASGAKAVKPPG